MNAHSIEMSEVQIWESWDILNTRKNFKDRKALFLEILVILQTQSNLEK